MHILPATHSRASTKISQNKPVSRSRRSRRRRVLLLWLAGGALCVALAANAGRWLMDLARQKVVLEEAAAFLDEGEYARAESSAREAVKLDPTSIGGCRLLARLCEKRNSAEAISWRARVVELDPADDRGRLDLAASYLQFGDAMAAGRTLESVSDATRQSGEFHRVAASTAMAAGDDEEAEYHFSELVKLYPSDKSYRLNLATLRLASSSDRKDAARKELEQLREDPDFEVPAVRALLNDDVRVHGGSSGPQASGKLLALARKLAASPHAEFQDQLLVLEFMKEAKDPGFDAFLLHLRQTAGEQPQDLCDLILWMNARGLAGDTLTWENALSDEESAPPEIRLAMADTLIQLEDWDVLEPRVAAENWGKMDYLRLAIASHLSRRKGDMVLAEEKFGQAAEAAGGNPSLLLRLARLCERWHWEGEAEDCLWIVAKGNAGQAQALDELRQVYETDHDSDGLWRVAKARYELTPDEPAAKSSFAFLSLLHLGEEAGKYCNVSKLSSEAYKSAPSDPAFALTYAYFLYLRGKFAEGLKVLDGLTEAQRESPNVSGYYGLLLVAADRRGEAAKYFTLADKNPQMLSEEKAMFAEAQSHGVR